MTASKWLRRVWDHDLKKSLCMLHTAFNLGIYQWQQMSHFAPTVLLSSQDHPHFDEEAANNPLFSWERRRNVAGVQGWKEAKNCNLWKQEVSACGVIQHWSRTTTICEKETNFLEGSWWHSHFVISSSNTYVKFITFPCLVKSMDLNTTG